MNKNITVMPKGKYESGVALIYALALLGLLLVMLLGFLSSSILEQRIAYNQSSQVGANLLAKSALIKIKQQMAAYADASIWAQYRSKQFDPSSGAPLIAPLVSINADSNESLGDGNKTNQATDAYLKLAPLLEKFGMTDSFFPKATQLDYPEWINYYVSDGKSASRRLAGRIAYAAIPNLGVDPALYKGSRITVGGKISQLNMCYDFFAPKNDCNPKLKSNWLSLDILTGYYKFLSYLNVNRVKDEFYKPDPDHEIITKKALINYSFTTFQPTVKDHIWAQGAFKPATAITDRYCLVGTTLDFPQAMELLKNTASDIQQRRQIAANLVDYIDSNGLPTSDVAPTAWETDTPSYTGNERTLYLNQIIPSICGKYTYTANVYYAPDGLSASVTQTINCEFSGRIWLELINIYDSRLEGTVVSNPILKAKITINAPPPSSRSSFSILKDNIDISDNAVSADTWENSIQLATQGTHGFGIEAHKYSEIKYPSDSITVQGKSVVYTIKNDGVPVNASGAVEFPVINFKIDVEQLGFERAIAGPHVVSPAHPSYYTDYVSGQSYTGIYPLISETPLTGVASSSKWASAYVNFEAYDPRCNLRPADWEQVGGVKVEKERDTDTLLYILESKENLGSKNSVAKFKNSDISVAKDLESDDDPVNVSNAYIRNAPMKSLWELGLIHRGRPFQTINLKNALNPSESHTQEELEGYMNDAQLLDRFTLLPTSTEKLKMFNINQPAHNKEIFAPVAGNHPEDNIQRGINYFNPEQRINYTHVEFRDEAFRSDNPTLTPDQTYSLQKWMAEKQYTDYSDHNTVKNYPRYIHRGMLANVIADWAMNGDSPYKPNHCRGDVYVEELIGKIVPLSYCGDTYENFTVFAVAETIKDVGSISGDKVIVKYDRNGDAHKQKCKYGEIDYDGDYMFDEITGRSYLVARLRREIVECQNTRNCQNGIHEPDCKFKIKVLESFVLNDL